MRTFLALIVVVYLVGVGVVLSPAVAGKWNGAPASELASTVVQSLPNALAWPAAAFRTITGRGSSAPAST